MKLSKNYNLREFIKSNAALRYNIPNQPSPEYISNLEKLCKNIMQPIRDAWKKPIIISSGYRSPLVNKIVKGQPGSQHLVGAACDFHTVSDTIEDNKKLFNMIVDMINEGIIECRQLILEKSGSWIHISIQDKYHSYKKNEILYR